MVEFGSRSLPRSGVLEAGGKYELIVDTGFNGHLYVPEDTIEAWGLPFVLSLPIRLADQSTVIADVYEATIVWFDVPVRAVVLAGPSACEALLGMELLEGCRLELDEKRAAYQALPSLMDYLMLAQDAPHATHFAREGEKWVRSDYGDLHASIVLKSIECVLTLSEVYAAVEFE